MASKLLLLVNALVLGMLAAHVYYTTTFEFPEVLRNQSCCAGEWIGNTCCSKEASSSGAYCYDDPDVVRRALSAGCLSAVKHYRWIAAVPMLIVGLTPFHANPEQRNDDFSPLVLSVWLLVGCIIILFLTANVILGYANTTECVNPDTRQFIMLKEHAPYDFWIMALGAWLFPMLIALSVLAIGINAWINVCLNKEWDNCCCVSVLLVLDSCLGACCSWICRCFRRVREGCVQCCMQCCGSQPQSITLDAMSTIV